MKAVHLLLFAGGLALLVQLEVQISSLKSSVDRLQLTETTAQNAVTLTSAGITNNKRPTDIRRLVSQRGDEAWKIPRNAMMGGQQDVSVVLYNRVPKTGSTTFLWVIHKLCYQLGYNVIQIAVSNKVHIMAASDQYDFVQNITTWTDKLPGFYHGHIAFINFQRFGVKQPMYIQIIREPLDRLVSHYYFLRYGDDFSPNATRNKKGDQTTFDECVAKRQYDCSPLRLWAQIPFFCGHEAACWKPGSAWALWQAKRHLLSNYLVVGITEQLPAFITVLEAMVPQFFYGASAVFEEMERINRSRHLRHTVKKDLLGEKTVTRMKYNRIYQMERHFYEYAKLRFESITKRIVNAGAWEKGQ